MGKFFSMLYLFHFFIFKELISMSFDSFRIDFFGDMFSFSGGNFVVFVFVGFTLEGFIFFVWIVRELLAFGS